MWLNSSSDWRTPTTSTPGEGRRDSEGSDGSRQDRTRCPTVGPATGKPTATYEAWDAAWIEATVARAHAASRAWARVPGAERAESAARLARTLRENAALLAGLAVAGVPPQSPVQVVFREFIDHAA
ncbi:aldehyde dehydrogenase family protein [Streptomyces sp. NPDC096310]|uniref:aldehyde dehydrogenase family protein n=1 Tax=Streptomyces sp. NPDC096310 TaxID=3366082 RepID=UPI00381C7FEF